MAEAAIYLVSPFVSMNVSTHSEYRMQVAYNCRLGGHACTRLPQACVEGTSSCARRLHRPRVLLVGRDRDRTRARSNKGRNELRQDDRELEEAGRVATPSTRSSLPNTVEPSMTVTACRGADQPLARQAVTVIDGSTGLRLRRARRRRRDASGFFEFSIVLP